MAKFTGADVVSMEYDFTAPVDYRPNPERPPDSVAAEDREQWSKDAAESLEHGRWTGTIPEPSGETLRVFMFRMQESRLKVAEFENKQIEEQQKARRDRWIAEHPNHDAVPDDDSLYAWAGAAELRANLTALAKARQESMHEQHDDLMLAVADFTENTPGVDVLRYLGYRPFERFLGWLSGHFSPEALRAVEQL